MAFKIVAIYNFIPIQSPEKTGAELEALCRNIGIRGTIILAPEGINGTVAGQDVAIDQLVDWLSNSNSFGNLLSGAEIKFSTADEMPFLRLKIRLKQEIVTLRAPEADPSKQVGQYVEPADWDALTSPDDVVVLDTRNDYEYAIGSFEGAVDPQTKTFTEFKKYVSENLDPARDKKVAMFCTGGIRCEKASSYMMAQGFEQVYHLKGGILKYLETVPEEQSSWNGECFVFDERVSVKHGLEEGDAELCRACRFPLTVQDRAHKDYILGEQCPHCSGPEFETMRRSAAERNRQIELAKQRGMAHLGDDAVSSARARAKSKKASRDQNRQRNR